MAILNLKLILFIAFATLKCLNGHVTWNYTYYKGRLPRNLGSYQPYNWGVEYGVELVRCLMKCSYQPACSSVAYGDNGDVELNYCKLYFGQIDSTDDLVYASNSHYYVKPYTDGYLSMGRLSGFILYVFSNYVYKNVILLSRACYLTCFKYYLSNPVFMNETYSRNGTVLLATNCSANSSVTECTSLANCQLKCTSTEFCVSLTYKVNVTCSLHKFSNTLSGACPTGTTCQLATTSITKNTLRIWSVSGFSGSYSYNLLLAMQYNSSSNWTELQSYNV